MINADLFETFAVVANTQSITDAARKLNVSKTAISLQIKKLEQQIGSDLFIRANQRIQLTENGILLLHQCRRLQKELDETRSMCKQFLDYPEGILRVCIFEHFANKLIFPYIASFSERFPKIQLAITISEEIPDFSTGDIDIAIGFASPPSDEDLIQKSLCKASYVLCGSPSLFQQYGYPEQLSEITKYKYICHENRIVSNQIIKLKQGVELEIKPYLVLNKISAMLECALNGIGIVQLPHYIVQSYLQTNQLHEIFPEYQATDKDIYYYYSKFRYVEPKIRRFIDFFLTGTAAIAM